MAYVDSGLGLSVDIVSFIDFGSNNVKYRIFCIKIRAFWAIKFCMLKISY